MKLFAGRPVVGGLGPLPAYDIKYINLGPLGIHMAWPETHDHAKWGITTHSNWVCVADINRMISQRKRGGGTIAFRNETLWRGLSKTTCCWHLQVLLGIKLEALFMTRTTILPRWEIR